MERDWFPVCIHAPEPGLDSGAEHHLRYLDLRHRPVRTPTEWSGDYIPVLGGGNEWRRGVCGTSLHATAGFHPIPTVKRAGRPTDLAGEVGLDCEMWGHGFGECSSRLH